MSGEGADRRDVTRRGLSGSAEGMSRIRKTVRMTDTPLFPETHVLAARAPVEDAGLNVTLFAGMGGACVGLERGLGQKVQWAVNHWPVAISVHRANHPETGHMIADVMEVDPLTVTGGRPVNILWASPDCTSFSPAKGAAPVEQGLRMLPFSMLMWAGKTRPRYIVGENVPAMARWWGPLVAKRKDGGLVYDKRGRLVKVNTKHPKKRDQRWRAFRKAFERLGYRFEWKVLNAADYGAPTRRERLFFVASRDGEAFPWPEPTHAPASDPRVLTGERLPWVPVGPLLDHDREIPSIFEKRRNGKFLKEATMVRTAWGVLKEVLQTDQPYLIGPEEGEAVQASLLIPDNHQNPAWSAWRPAPTLTGQTNRIMLGGAGLRALTSAAVAAPFITKAYTSKKESHNRSASLYGSLPTITAQDHNQLAAAQLLHVRAGFLSTYYGGTQGETRSGSLSQPVTTLTGARRQALGQVPLTSGAAHLVWYNRGDTWHSVALNGPVRTLTGKARAAYALTRLEEFGNTAYHNPDLLPAPVMGAGQGKTQAPKSALRLEDVDLTAHPHAHDVYDLLLRVCGREAITPYADHERRLIYRQVGDRLYLVPDIGLRMLHYTELAKAQGFTDYILDRGADGEQISAEDVVKMIGNSVCPQMGEAFGRVLAQLLQVPSEDRPPLWWSRRQGRGGHRRVAA